MGKKQTYSQLEQKRGEAPAAFSPSPSRHAGGGPVIWQLLVSVSIVSSRFLPAPTAIVNTFEK